jgi:trehalose 6-phosphate phosphatase
MSDRQDWWHEIDAAKTAFFLDVDGTLLGFRERPEDVIADVALLALLRRLQAAADGAVALVSGRMVSDLDRIVAPLVLPLGAVHGTDLRYADGRRETAEASSLAHVRAEAQAFVTAHPGLRLEDKGATIAVHYRQAPDMAAAVKRLLDDAVVGHDLMVQHGKMVAEVKSASGHKGTAIAQLMRTPPFEGRVPLFIGDDLTDEHGFATVNDFGGVSIKVGGAEERTVARYRLANTQDVRNVLDTICRTTSSI